jgi:hypothetical protein
VLAEELETLTDMVALAKKENEKQFKEDLSKVKSELQEEMATALAQRGKESTIYTDKVAARSEENMKNHTKKEIKFAN